MTLDISALYTNILMSLEQLSRIFLIDSLTNTYLHNFYCNFWRSYLNYFRFQNQFFYQVQGTAMGSTCAPSITKLFMQHFEETYMLPITNNPFLKQYYYLNASHMTFFFYLEINQSYQQFLNGLTNVVPQLNLWAVMMLVL